MKELIINGKPLPIHFGMKAISEYTKLRGTDFQDAVTSTEFLGGLDAIVSLAATGLNEGARRSGRDERYTEDDVWDMIDDNPQLILDVSAVFVESIAPLTDKLGGMVKNASGPAGKSPKPGSRKKLPPKR